MIDGLLIVDKPAGMTSHDVVARCRKVFGQKKVGHAGTLDPDATGVLVLGLGWATRLLQFQSGLPKCYSTEIVLGVATTTLDASGEVTGRWEQRHVTVEDARRAAHQLTGQIWQLPPMVSAIKVGGRRLHELARQGVEVERSPRPVTVTSFSVDGPADDPHDEVHHGGPVLAVRVACSSGTYVRVLAADLGAALGGGVYVRRLRRTAVGPWTEAKATPLEALSPADVIPPVASLPWFDAVVVDSGRAAEVANGRVLERAAMSLLGDGPWRVLDSRGTLLAIYERHGPGMVKPAMVMPAPVP